jgi:hypothetical protein
MKKHHILFRSNVFWIVIAVSIIILIFISHPDPIIDPTMTGG